MKITKEQIENYISSKRCTLWGAWDISQPTSFSEAVEFMWKAINEMQIEAAANAARYDVV